MRGARGIRRIVFVIATAVLLWFPEMTSATTVGAVVTTPHRVATGAKGSPASLDENGGYFLAGADGSVFTFGGAQFLGSMAGHRLNAPIVGIATWLGPTNGDGSPGYYLVGADGSVFAFGAPFYGSLAGVHLQAPIVGIAPFMDAGEVDVGYYLVGADGSVFAFGAAPFMGSMANVRLVAPIVGMATWYAYGEGGGPPNAVGYYLVGADGSVFALGDAPFEGSMSGRSLIAPIVGIVNVSSSLVVSAPFEGYDLADSAGSVFALGQAPFQGSMASERLNAPIVGFIETFSYELVGADGSVFAFGGMPFDGSLANTVLEAPIVGGAW